MANIFGRKDPEKSERLKSQRKKDDSKSKLYLDVPHVKQLSNWDCGVACCLMVLKRLNLDHGMGIIGLQNKFQTRSIWTIDMAHVLHQYGVDVAFYTVTIGANPEFAKEKYYMSHMSEDAARVERLFQLATSIGIPIIKRSVTMKEIIQFITSKQYLIILLVDLRKISTWLGAADACFMTSCCMANGMGYQGHYIILCGYDQQRSQLLLMDPVGRNGIQRQSKEAIEEARKSYGTDEDLLLINLERKQQDENTGSDESQKGFQMENYVMFRG